jgi:hypothetical protein
MQKSVDLSILIVYILERAQGYCCVNNVALFFPPEILTQLLLSRACTHAHVQEEAKGIFMGAAEI